MVFYIQEVSKGYAILQEFLKDKFQKSSLVKYKFLTYLCFMKIKLLDQINSPADLRKLPRKDLERLSAELRDFIIDIVSTKKGHLGASLGVVELTIALHYFFNTPEDLLVWDVGHQAYGHKILTGRKDQFNTNRKLGGISGFPKISESDYDTFGVGHSSTSISAALGMAISEKLQNNKHETVAIIGDAAIASGMAFEGLNHAGVSDTNIWVILNDNAMGIDPSVGALKEYLSHTTIGEKHPQDNIFEALNFHYEGPIDGHDFDSLFKAFEKLKTVEGPKFLHVISTKGKGLQQAEDDQVLYHAPGKFDKLTGEIYPEDTTHLPPKFQDVFGLTLIELAQENEKIIGVTAAMPTGTSMKMMMDKFPERTFDVGIAEQHAVTFSAGMATKGSIVFCAIYSTFLQRAYDQVIHDVAIQDLPVIFCIDRAGLVGEDGPTHHGVFDLAYLNCIPNIQIIAPADEIELRNILYTVSKRINHPTAIRYPRGRGNIVDWKKPFEEIEIGKGRLLKDGKNIAILSLGTIKTNVIQAINEIQESDEIAHYDMRSLKPLDEKLLHDIFAKYQRIVTIEDGVKIGGFGDAIISFKNKNNYKKPIFKMGIPDVFIEHGSLIELQEIAGISSSKIKEVLKNELSLLIT